MLQLEVSVQDQVADAGPACCFTLNGRGDIRERHFAGELQRLRSQSDLDIFISQPPPNYLSTKHPDYSKTP